jgi:hypothetical protein
MDGSATLVSLCNLSRTNELTDTQYKLRHHPPPQLLIVVDRVGTRSSQSLVVAQSLRLKGWDGRPW